MEDGAPVDLVLFVSGQGSSNGHYLYDYCKNVQPNTRLVYGVEDIDSSWFAPNGGKSVERVGITGATSTPRWLMEAIGTEINNITPQQT